MPQAPKNLNQFESLVAVVAALRGPDGCPWDKEQTHKTLTQYAIEEAHELAQAIDQGDKAEMVEELGDLLLQVLLHAEIGRQAGTFTLSDVIEGIATKMVRRHPHVFSDVTVKDSAEVLKNWADIKAQEKPAKVNDPFANIPKALPALLRAQKIGSKTVRYNFDWENSRQVFAKVMEEVSELQEAMAAKSQNEQQNELGDVLFTIAQLARHLDFDAEQALRMTNQKFEKRFAKMREIITESGLDFMKLSAADLESYWQKAKIFDEPRD